MSRIDDEYDRYHGFEDKGWSEDEEQDYIESGISSWKGPKTTDKPSPWEKGIGTLAVDLALMSKGGLLKDQAE